MYKSIETDVFCYNRGCIMSGAGAPPVFQLKKKYTEQIHQFSALLF